MTSATAPVGRAQGNGAGRLSTGIRGLDVVLLEGLVPGRVYVARGGPGTGKTTLALNFLTAVRNGRSSLLVTLSQSESQVRENAAAVGIDMSGVEVLDLAPTEDAFTDVDAYDIFSPADVERKPTTQRIMQTIDRLKPERACVDSITQLRYLSPDAHQFRKQLMALARYLTGQGATVLFTSEASRDAPDDDVQFLCDGVINLEYGPDGRTISVSKFRGSNFIEGPHSMRIARGGVRIAPRLLPLQHEREFVVESLPSGIPELDEHLQGGIERGTVTIITGPTGVGKTSLGLQFMKEAAGRGERSVVYTFEENLSTLVQRCSAISIPTAEMTRTGKLSIVQIEPLDYSPDEFAGQVRQEVEDREARIVMVDSVVGYQLSLRHRDLDRHLHALCRYLRNMGVTTILINEVEAITGDFMVTEHHISHLADTVVFLRYLELGGQIHRAIGVLKKRTGDFDKSLRELEITRYGIKVGRPLTGLRSILTGTPELAAGAKDLWAQP